MVTEIMMIGAVSMGMGGLGASVASGQKLTTAQIYTFAKNAGFPPATATQMTAIALRESGGYTGALNTGDEKHPETSKGLWQINVNDPSVRNFLTSKGVDINNLNDPAVNAQAAYYMWGGNDANLDVAWYINRPGYKEDYEKYLPAAVEASTEVDGTAGLEWLTGGGSGIGDPVDSGLDLNVSELPDWAPMAAVAAGLLAYAALS